MPPLVPYSYVPTEPREPSVLDYWNILLKRKWLVLTTAVVVFTLVAVATFHTTPIYEAAGEIAIYPDNPAPLGFKDGMSTQNVSDDWDYTVALSTQSRVLQSDTLALQVIRNLQLDRNPRFAGYRPPSKQDASKTVLTGATVDDAQQDALVGAFRSGLTITIIPNTRLIEIRYASPDPKLAADIVNALAQAYVENNRRSKYDSTIQTSDWLKQQLADLQVKVETSQQQLADYEKAHGILGIDEKQNIITSKLDELNKDLTEAESDRMQKQAVYNQMVAAAGHAASDPVLEQLRQQEADVKTQLAQATVQFGPAYPKVVELNSKLKQIQASIQNETRRAVGRSQSDYQAAVQREAMLRSALDKQKQEANQLNESAIQYNILKKEADTNRQLYDDLLQKLKEASIEAGLKATNVRLVDLARVPLAPSKPNIPRNLALGLLMGLMGGVTLAFVVELLDNTVRTPEEVQTVSALPSLGIVPLSAGSSAKKLKNQRLLPSAATRGGVGIIAYSRPRSEIAEAYRALRTSILLSSLGTPPKVILVTSALPQEGKTTTSMNCAIVLAQKGGKVLLVDADLRRPGVHQMMGMSSRQGLSTVLTGSSTPETVIQTSRQLKNLFVLPAGPTPPQPAELLGSDHMRSLLLRWREEYDHIVIDTPPALTVTDSVLLSPAVDAVILVIRSGRTPKDALRRARDLLAQVNARVMGVVVNAIDLQSPDMYYYYYGAKHGGHYYDENAAR